MNGSKRFGSAVAPGVETDGLTSVPLRVETDLANGGRWTSLRSQPQDGYAREWLWTNPDPGLVEARAEVCEQASFIDAGGGEECYPSLRTPYDHGLVWNRPWRREGRQAVVEAAGFRLRRSLNEVDGAVRADYSLTSREVAEVIHAVHLLLDLSPAAKLHTSPHDQPAFFNALPEDEIRALGGMDGFIRSLGAGEPGANCFLLPGCRRFTIVDGVDSLQFILDGPAGLPLGLVVWRNLEGWPEHAPYRSIGIEPAVGGDAQLPSRLTGGSVYTDPEAPIEWSLTLSAWRLNKRRDVA